MGMKNREECRRVLFEAVNDFVESYNREELEFRGPVAYCDSDRLFDNSFWLRGQLSYCDLTGIISAEEHAELEEKINQVLYGKVA